MTNHRVFGVVLAVSVAAALAVSCGGSSPTAPGTSSTSSSSSSTSAPPGTPPPGGSGGGALVTVAGFVPGAIPPSGACPAIRFGVESKQTGAYIDTAISADATTQYSGGTCSDVVLGTFLEVQGQQQADKSLHASVVKFTPKGAPILASR